MSKVLLKLENQRREKTFRHDGKEYTFYEQFVKQHEAVVEARSGRARGRSAGRSGEGGKSQKGPNQTRQQMDRAGYGYDKESGNYYRYLRENGKLALDEKGARMLDYDKGPASPESLAEAELKANGQGLPLPQQAAAQAPQQAGQATPRTRFDEFVDREIADAEKYEGEYLDVAIDQNVSPVEDLAWRSGQQGSALLAPMEWQDYEPEMNTMAAEFMADAGDRSRQRPASVADLKRAGVRGALLRQEYAPFIDADYQRAAADVENYDSQLRKGLQGALRTKLWGAAAPGDRDVDEYRTRQFNERREAEQALQRRQWNDSLAPSRFLR